MKVPVVLGAIAAIAIAERLWPLRTRREKQAPHVVRDLAAGALSAIAMKACSAGLRPASRRPPGRRHHTLHIAAQILLLDYTLFLWHAANHHVPLLWRFHRFHHQDRDLDTATAARFHPAEMSLSVLFRWLQVRVIDPDPLAMSIWQTMLLSSIVFHHSNTRLPQRADDAMARALVTPRMHGIHHSAVPEETNSNFASLFTWWDMLHGTYRIDVSQESITIGAPV
ncbi:MAG TPA: sterol desaturase family protein [Thermoanaerobaculia bacterium]|nr:sterol desaturase family protein [Thermoanaerobaculia bacterium]